eukprot:6689403-Alexandrium_andersonii.AAC.1
MDDVRVQPDQAIVSEGIQDLADHGEAVVARLTLLALPAAVWRELRPRLAPAMAGAAPAVPPLIQVAERTATVEAELHGEAALK